MLQRIRGQIFLIGLALSVVVGFSGHAWLAPWTTAPLLKPIIVVIVMSMMAAPVPLELFVKTVSRPWPGILASLICFLLIPLMGWLTKALLNADLAGGLIVACCVPSTLASSAVITRKAGGDDTVPIFVTILTNLTCVVVTPMWLVLLMGGEARISVAELIYELAVLVVLPIVTMQLLRWRSQRFCTWAKQAKGALSAACQFGILLMVMLGSVQMGSRWHDPSNSSNGTFFDVFSLVILGLVIHLTALGLGVWFARLTKIPPAQAIGVGFAGSQKTLMIGINLAIDYGVSILPMISYHVSQLLVDAFIADYWRHWNQRSVRQTEESVERSAD